MLTWLTVLALAIFQTSEQASVSTQLDTARQVLLQAFPDFAGRSVDIYAMLNISSKRDLRWFPDVGFRLSEIVHRGGVQETVPLGTVAMMFEPSGTLLTWSAHGPFVDSDRLEQLGKDVDAHQEWTDQQVLARLRLAGADVLPDGGITSEQRVVASMMRLSPTFGSLQVTSLNFSYRYDTGGGNAPLRAELDWVVRFTFTERNGRLRHGAAHFEPFEARMLSIWISDR